MVYRLSRAEVPMTRHISTLLLLSVAAVPHTSAQVFNLSKEQLLKYTAQNPFDRFPDGRPKVPDALLEKLKDMSSEEVLGLNARGFRNQWEAGWQVLHPE